MICIKFGGTCVTPDNLHYVADIVDENVGPIVVSAVGREFWGDEKLTDLLEQYAASRQEETWQKICGKILRLCRLNDIDVDVDQMLYEAKQRADKHGKDYCLSLGEELTAKCVAVYLGREYIEAADYVAFVNGKLDEIETERKMRQLVGRRFVVGGFYGGTDSGERVTFARGGGDVSGAIFAVLCKCSLYDNRTDVDGVCTADPNKVCNAEVLRQISYAQMQLLSECGATVLHPDALTLPCSVGMPIVVRSVYDKQSLGTTISFCPSRLSVVSITSKNNAKSTITLVLHNMTAEHMFACLASADKLTDLAEEIVWDKQSLQITSKQDLTALTYATFAKFDEKNQMLD